MPRKSQRWCGSSWSTACFYGDRTNPQAEEDCNSKLCHIGGNDCPGNNKLPERPVRIIDGCLTKSQRAKLDALVEKGPDDSFRYPLTLLKKSLQWTRPSKIKVKLTDLKTLLALYLDLKPVVTALALNNESIRYYAYSVIKFRIPQVSRRRRKPLPASDHVHCLSNFQTPRQLNRYSAECRSSNNQYHG